MTYDWTGDGAGRSRSQMPITMFHVHVVTVRNRWTNPPMALSGAVVSPT
jgi:hypothetical protein